jgi:acyl-CoA thioester hydrolase
MSRGADETRSGYRLVVQVPTRWADNDSYGHVNNATYYSYFDTAVNLVLTGRGLLDLHRSEVICMVVETGCRFHRAVSFPDVLDVGLRIARMGRSSVRWEIALFRGPDAEPAATGHFVHVYVDRATRRPTPVPEEVRRTLADLVTPGSSPGP